MRRDAATPADPQATAHDAAAREVPPLLPRMAIATATVVVAIVAVIVPAIRLGTSRFVVTEGGGIVGLAPAAILGAIWIVVLAWLGRRLLYRALEVRSPASSAESTLVVAALSILFAVGLDWGLPGPGWALDEMGADAVLAGLYRGFANGWNDQYPPLHYYVLALVYAPTLAIEKLGLFSASWPSVKFLLLLHTRLVSLAMAIGTVAVMGLVGDRLLGRRYGWLTALCAGLFLPFVFYAKTANLEAPYLFWSAIALAFLVDVHQTGRTRAWIGAGMAAALAVTTKDQAYGLFGLPMAWLAWRHLRAARGVRPLALGVLCGIATFAAVHNVAFNAAGFKSHVELVVGPASQPIRMVESTLAGQLDLAGVVGDLLLWMFGAAGLIAVGLGISNDLGSRFARHRNLEFPPQAFWRLKFPSSLETTPEVVLPIWLLLAPVSYYVTFVIPAAYVYDRFLLPVVLACAPIAAVGIRRLLDGWPGRAFGRIAGVGLLLMLVWRAVSVDALLLRDSRYRAEAWMAANIPSGSVVAASSQPAYLPRVPGDYRYLEPTADATVEMGPDFIVVNTEFHRRHPPESPRRLWLKWLESGGGPYEQVFRYKAPLRWSALRIGRRFRDGVEDPSTNLDKINPEIAIFQRRGG